MQLVHAGAAAEIADADREPAVDRIVRHGHGRDPAVQRDDGLAAGGIATGCLGERGSQVRRAGNRRAGFIEHLDPHGAGGPEVVAIPPAEMIHVGLHRQPGRAVGRCDHRARDAGGLLPLASVAVHAPDRHGIAGPEQLAVRRGGGIERDGDPCGLAGRQLQRLAVLREREIGHAHADHDAVHARLVQVGRARESIRIAGRAVGCDVDLHGAADRLAVRGQERPGGHRDAGAIAAGKGAAGLEARRGDGRADGQQRGRDACVARGGHRHHLLDVAGLRQPHHGIAGGHRERGKVAAGRSGALRDHGLAIGIEHLDGDIGGMAVGIVPAGGLVDLARQGDGLARHGRRIDLAGASASAAIVIAAARRHQRGDAKRSEPGAHPAWLQRSIHGSRPQVRNAGGEPLQQPSLGRRLMSVNVGHAASPAPSGSQTGLPEGQVAARR
ncbi:hypothetical protein D3C72_1154170 [compost metagenome]